MSPSLVGRRSRSRSRSPTIAHTCASARAGGLRRGPVVGAVGPPRVERGEQLGHALAGRGRREQDLGALGPGPDGGRAVAGADWRGDEHRPELGGRPLGARPVALVDDDDVGHLEQARLDRLDLVAHLGRLEHDGRVGGGRDLDLALAGPDRLDEHQVEAGGVEDGRRRAARRGEAAGVAPRAIERMNTSGSSA